MAKILNLDSIKAQSDIVEVVSHFLPLQKQGDNHKACCPFHKEGTPSFVVSQAKQIYHCFGCGVGGDVFSFVMAYKKCEFSQAVEIIANMQGLSLEYAKGEGSKKKSKYKDFCELNEVLNEMFVENLANPKSEMAKKCQDYLKKRGILAEDFSRYDVGFIPKTDEILARLSSYQWDLALELGFLRKNKEREGYYCPLSERISFALRNSQHKVAGFSARSHPYKNFRNAGKYINSNESEIFKKSQILYRYTHAKSVIASKKRVFVVEGFMDALALDKMDIKNAVATCGTAFSLAHLSMLIKTPEIEIIFCFDKDEAGGQAAIRSLDLCYKAGYFEAKVAWAKNEVKDFGEVLERGEDLELKEINGFEFILRYKLKHAQNNAQKQAVLDYAKEVIKSCELYYTKQELIEQASYALKIPKEYLTQKSTPKQAQSPLPSVEKILLKSALFDEKMAFILREVLQSEGVEIFATQTQNAKDFLSGAKTQNLIALEIDDGINIFIDTFAFSEALKSLQKSKIKSELERARASKNIDLLLFWQKKARDLEMPF